MEHMTTFNFNNLIRPQSSHKHNANFFLYFYQTLGVQQEFNIMYLQIINIRLQSLHSQEL